MRFRGRGISHSDVTAVMGGIAFEQLSTDRVALKGVKLNLRQKKLESQPRVDNKRKSIGSWWAWISKPR
jgi:hypothetical protein